jgi:hypothetical protein
MEALPPDKYQTALVTNSQTIKEIQMNKTLMSVVLLLGFAVLVGLSVASYAAESVGNVVDDTVITTTVKAELAKDVRLATLTGIEVSTTRGVVTLAGKVHNSQDALFHHAGEKRTSQGSVVQSFPAHRDAWESNSRTAS